MRHIQYNNKQNVLKQYYDGIPPTVLSKEYNIPQSTLFYWISKYSKSVVLKKEREDKRFNNWSKLQSHSDKQELEIAFLKRTVVKKIPLKECLSIIDNEYGKESLHVQCEALDVNRSTYLNHRYRNKNDNAWFKRREAEYCEIISKIYEESGHVYGAKKITAIMKKQGKPVSYKYIQKLMAECGLKSIWSLSNKNRLIVARNLRESAHASSDFKVSKINQVWVSDTSSVFMYYLHYLILS